MQKVEIKEEKTILSLDFGTQKIGVAVGEALVAKAFPLGIIAVKNDDTYWNSLDKYIYEWKPTLIIIGYPLGIDGKKNKMTKLVDSFAQALNERYNIKYELVDERYSSFEAREILKEKKKKKEKKQNYDNLSATLILEYWFAQR